MVCVLLCLALLASAAWAEEATYDGAMRHYLAGETEQALRLFTELRRKKDIPEHSLWIGWCNLRLNRLKPAQEAFEHTLQLQRPHLEATAGLGYVQLRQGHLAQAEAFFRQAIPSNLDALVGMALVASRRENSEEARRVALQVLARDPGNQTAKDILEAQDRNEPPEPPVRPRGPIRRPEALDLRYRTGRQYFQVRQADGTWKDFYMQGMNLGPALPGRFPSQFVQSRAQYREWLDQMGQMGCNVVRVYTVLPPGFYQAFYEYHQDPKSPPLYLVHGVWAEEPPAHDYLDPAYSAEFRQEIHYVLDLLHGQADIPARAGHAYGKYTDDVSPWVLAILLGREWEPYTVVGFNRLYPRFTYQGKYISARPGASPMEACMALFCDETVDYEMKRYHATRPLSFTNWPTLDPLYHLSEATRAEGAGILAERGESNPNTVREYDNDAVGITVSHLQAMPSFGGGLYASYHAYPYYPDFMLNEKAYAQARSSYGPSHYMGYLRELKAYYKDMPLIIGEYGLPSSRGDCHLQPQGLDHGGHTEAHQAEGDVRLTREIREAGCAGGCLFAWIDEWFKKNWLVIDREIPLERNRLWLNYLDAEQNYGIIAMRPDSETRHTLTGQASEWTGAPLATGPDGQLRVTSDEGFIYLGLSLPHFNPAKDTVTVAIDTVGDSTPEYLLRFSPTESRLLVNSGYRPYIEIPGPPSLGSALVPNPRMIADAHGEWIPWEVESNRARLGRDGTTYKALRQEWGQLRRGSLVQGRQDYTSLADWHLDNGVLEVRLPWALLSVTDPSSHQVIHEPWDAASIDTRTTEGFTFTVKTPEGTWTTSPRYRWRGWEKPTWHAEVKPVFEAMRTLFHQWGGRP